MSCLIRAKPGKLFERDYPVRCIYCKFLSVPCALKVHPTRDDQGALALTFEHPTMPGSQPGGWMVKEEKDPAVAETKKPVEKKVVLSCLCFVSWAVRELGYCSFEIVWKASTGRVSM